MEFFEWSDFIQYIMDMFSYGVANTNEAQQRYLLTELIVGVSVGGAIWIALLILGGIGLSKMAKKEGKRNRFLAFIPFFNTFYAGHVAGEARFFGQKMKRAGLYAAIVEALYCAIGVVMLVTQFLFLPYVALQPGVDVWTGQEITQLGIDSSAIPINLRWLYRAVYGGNAIGFGWLSIIHTLLMLVFIVLFFVLLVALFKKYYPRNPILMTVLCALFPVSDLAFFLLRNREPFDYDAYLRRRAEEMRRRQYGPYGPTYGPTYGPQAGMPPRDEPFSDFGGSHGDGGDPPPPPPGDDNPFSDF